jgi:hypothetical protein
LFAAIAMSRDALNCPYKEVEPATDRDRGRDGQAPLGIGQRDARERVVAGDAGEEGVGVAHAWHHLEPGTQEQRGVDQRLVDEVTTGVGVSRLPEAGR